MFSCYLPGLRKTYKTANTLDTKSDGTDAHCKRLGTKSDFLIFFLRSCKDNIGARSQGRNENENQFDFHNAFDVGIGLLHKLPCLRVS